MCAITKVVFIVTMWLWCCVLVVCCMFESENIGRVFVYVYLHVVVCMFLFCVVFVFFCECTCMYEYVFVSV